MLLITLRFFCDRNDRFCFPGVKPYACSECDRSFTQRCSLESHCRKVHNMDISYAYKQRRNKIYVCEECGHSTADASQHFVHLRENHPNNPALTKCHDRRQFKFCGENQQNVHLPRTWLRIWDFNPKAYPSEKTKNCFNLYWMARFENLSSQFRDLYSCNTRC